MVKKLFGTDGIRGETNQFPILAQSIIRIAQCFGLILKKRLPHNHLKILIGKDTRASGYMIENALSSGFTSMGIDVLFVGPLPTPGIAYLTTGLRASAGIMISASHNPYHDNGIKFFDENGYKLSDEIENEIEALFFNQDEGFIKNKLVTPKEIGKARRIDDAIGQYSVFLKESFPKNLKLDGFKIVLDTAHGAGYKVAPKVFSELGAEIHVINQNPNGFNINENCGALFPSSLQKEVLAKKAHLGIALDGDADRILLVDNQGNIVDGDEILAICAIYLQGKGLLKNDGVCSTIMSNLGLKDVLNAHGIKLVISNVGDRFVLEKMLHHELVLGGEPSGHIIFLNQNTTGDPFIAALKILEIMIDKKKSLSELAKVMTHIPQKTKSISISKKPPLENLTETHKVVKNFEKQLKDKGRILLRYSGTEKKARLTVECQDKIKLDDIIDEVELVLKKEINDYPEV